MQYSLAHRRVPWARQHVAFLGFGTAALLFCSALSFQARAITLNYANLPTTDISFSGSTFNFTSATNGYQFAVTSVSGGAGDSVGLQGYLAPGGPFVIGPISIFGPEQTAPVTGASILHITDAHGIDLTGNLVWENITTFGVGGILDLTGTLNLTGITYGGVNSDLHTLAVDNEAADVVTFQFVPAQTLTQLATTGGQSSYSGSITAMNPVPEPGTLTLVGMGLAGLLVMARRRK